MGNNFVMAEQVHQEQEEEEQQQQEQEQEPAKEEEQPEQVTTILPSFNRPFWGLVLLASASLSLISLSLSFSAFWIVDGLVLKEKCVFGEAGRGAGEPGGSRPGKKNLFTAYWIACSSFSSPVSVCSACACAAACLESGRANPISWVV